MQEARRARGRRRAERAAPRTGAALELRLKRTAGLIGLELLWVGAKRDLGGRMG